MVPVSANFLLQSEPAKGVKWGIMGGSGVPHLWFTLLWSAWNNGADLFQPFGARSWGATRPREVDAGRDGKGVHREWGRMAAAGVVATVPATLVTVFCYRYIVAGLGGLHER